jgi:hypothetical protein
MKPYVTKGLLRSIKTRDKLYHRHIKKPQDAELERHYKDYRNRLTTLLRTSKKNFYHEKISKAKGNIKETWNILNGILKPPSPSPSVELYTTAGVKTEPRDVAKAFNDFFLSILNDNALRVTQQIKPAEITTPVNSFFLAPVSPQEIYSITSSLKSKHSAGVDGISSYFLKKIIKSILTPVVHLVNLMFETGTFPDEAKIATIIPLHKKGNRSEMSNYRPISILPALSKIFEKAILKRMSLFESQHNLFHNFQFGFRKQRSTASALLSLSNEVLKNLDKGNYNCMISLDLSKAFDSVDHALLISKLQWYGFKGKIIDLIGSYLRNRIQCTRYRDCLSSPGVIKRGVPQGALLSPFLFLIFINDMAHLPCSSKLFQYADDSSLLRSGPDICTMLYDAQNDINCVATWLRQNGLKINEAKTQYLLIHDVHKPIAPSIPGLKLNGILLERVNALKFLGVQLDNHLSWKFHIGICISSVFENIFRS